MKTTDDIARMTYFDCWCCTPITKCDHVGDMECCAMIVSTIAWEMIMDGRY